MFGSLTIKEMGFDVNHLNLKTFISKPYKSIIQKF